MPKILKNYRIKKDGTVEVLNNDVVYIDMPICVMEMYKEYCNPDILKLNENDAFSILVEKEEKEKYLNLREYKLVVGAEGKLKEATTPEEEKISLVYNLPKDINIDSLRYEKGELLLLDREGE